MRATDFFATHPVFTTAEFAASTGHGPARSPRTVESLLATHVASGRLLHVRRGLYASVPVGQTPTSFQPDPYLIASRLAPDATIAFHAALQLRGKSYSLWQRISVMTRNTMRLLHFQGNDYLRVAHPAPLRELPDLGGGIVVERHAGGDVRVTTLERTMVDVLDAPDLGGGWEEVWRSLELVEYFDLEAVVHHALALRSALTCARVGLYLEQHREELFVHDDCLAMLAAHAPKQHRYLDGRRVPGRLVKPWNLIVPEAVLRRTWEEPGELESGRMAG